MDLALVKAVMEYSSSKDDPYAYCKKVLNNCITNKILSLHDFELAKKSKESKNAGGLGIKKTKFTDMYSHNWNFEELEKLESEYIDKKLRGEA